MISLKNDKEFAAMRRAGRIVADVLAWAQREIRPGMTTGDIDAEAERIIRAAGATPEFKGYRGFPASTCLSVNEQVVHGIPGRYRLKDGDVLGVDVGARIDGFVGDAAVTVPVGKVTPEAQRLVDADTKRHDHVLKPGMAICIEPMLNVGRADVRVLEDGWTVVTRDGKLSAHFEHTVAIRETGAEVLTVL